MPLHDTRWFSSGLAQGARHCELRVFLCALYLSLFVHPHEFAGLYTSSLLTSISRLKDRRCSHGADLRALCETRCIARKPRIEHISTTDVQFSCMPKMVKVSDLFRLSRSALINLSCPASLTQNNSHLHSIPSLCSLL